jgi:DNA helicase-2/ATP-dependent DNA helicase PcrA
MMVLAGPGTGKTRVLTYHAARLVEKGLASPHDVLAVTFTRKAAAEMRERVQLLLGYDVDGLNMSTIHSLCHRILSVATKKRLQVLDTPAAFGLFRRAALEVNLEESLWDREVLFQRIQRAKSRLVGPDEYVQVEGSYYERQVGRVYRRYQQLLAQDRKLDLGDLVFKAVELLEDHLALLAHLRALSPYVLVDEFQDTSMGQYELLKRLAAESRNLFVVLSPAQALYEWRGAYADRLMRAMEEDFPEVKTITLEANYRSVGTIVAASGAVINDNGRYRDAHLTAMREDGDPIAVGRFRTAHDVAAFVAAESRKLREGGISWSKMAVLYRSHSQAYVLEKHLADATIPYTQRDKLYQQEEVGQVLAYLRLAEDPGQPTALDAIVNVPPRGIGPNSLRRMKQGSVQLTTDRLAETVARGLDWKLSAQVVEAAYDLLGLVTETLPSKSHLPPAELIAWVLETTRFVDWLTKEFDGARRLGRIRQLQDEAADFGRLGAFLDYAGDRSDGFLDSNKGIQLSTIHAAKGLEFDAVFVIGLEEGMLPHGRALKTARDPAGERRLCYVAMTRARDRLYMLCSDTGGRSRRQRRRPSRYFGDLPRDLLRQVH